MMSSLGNVWVVGNTNITEQAKLVKTVAAQLMISRDVRGGGEMTIIILSGRWNTVGSG